MSVEEYALHDHLFNWNPDKNLSNIIKHGVPFKEAATVFLDPFATLIEDEDTYGDEDRFNIIGISGNLRLLMVCHCYRGEGEIIRIISARKATKPEEGLYGGTK